MLTTILGLQFGDEGKGKLTDFFASQYDYIVRYQGGDNAGHSITINDQKFHVRIIPSGIFSGKKVVIANGVALNIKILLNEIDYLKQNNLPVEKLFISELAHVIMPYHIAMDELNENNKSSEQKIGTTKRGIGPCYTDKYERVGVRVKDLYDYETLLEKIQISLKNKNILFKANGMPEFDAEIVAKEYFEIGKQIKQYVTDTILLLNKAVANGEKILLEGAQGSMLDIEFGTYPFVTSSSPMTAISQGTGVAYTKLTNTIGIVKAYLTRVGSGPMLTELHDEISEIIREKGHEYGVVTKRPRRIGWLDLVQLKYTTMISGCTEVVITLLDVLSNLETIKVCTRYVDPNGNEIHDYIHDEKLTAKCTPVYKEFAGWKEDITGIRNYKDLPENCKKYLDFLAKFLNVKISYVSVGPDREQTIKAE